MARHIYWVEEIEYQAYQLVSGRHVIMTKSWKGNDWEQAKKDICAALIESAEADPGTDYRIRIVKHKTMVTTEAPEVEL